MRNALLKRGLHLLLAVVTVLVLAGSVGAQQQTASKPATNPLVRLLQSKGILTDEEATMVSRAATATEADQRLARLLLSKGLITQEDYNQTVGAAMVSTVADVSGGARMIPAVMKVPLGSAGSAPAATPAPQPKGPAVIPAVAPIRVFPVDPPKHEGLIPAFKLGPVKVAPYGFFKASVVYDSSSPQGNDFPLPGFLPTGVAGSVDTGPDASPEFHIKARGLRIGSNFEWLDPSPNVTLTGRFEFDFEGNFSRAANRNVSTIRSNMASIRLAWARVDWKVSDQTTLFGLFGQDWTPFGSSTLPPLFETTGLGVFFGSLYERAPQARFGFNYNIGGSRKVKIQPEVAVVLPAFGNVPGDANLGLQLAFGERQGVDSARPEVEGRLVTQFQLDDAPGVAPAQIIVSGMQGRRTAVVRAGDVPAAFQSAFPTGASASSNRWGATGEVQLPTRYATLIAKYYSGNDLRFFFGGQAFSHYNDTLGLCPALPCTTPTNSGSPGSSIDGSDSVVFGFNTAGTAVVAPQRPVRSQGGFVNLSFPLSRIANADPAGHNAGWALYLHYGIDFAKARDLRHFASTSAGSRVKSDLGAVTIQYKLNPFVSFIVEESYYRTRALKGSNLAGTTPFALPLFQGVRVNAWHDFRSEIGTVFTF